jgi:hypothetical protein
MSIIVLAASNSATPKSRTMTDDEGKYTIEGLTPGEYAIYPFNETTQYPLRADMFLSKSPDRITVNNSQTTVNKDLVLPSEAATVHGNVLNDAGAPLPNAEVILCHTDEVWRSATIPTEDDGTFFYIVPSDEAITIVARAPGIGQVIASGIIFHPDEDKKLTFKIIKGAKASVKDTDICIPFKP